MRRIFLPLAAIIFIYLLSACAIGSMTDSRPTPPPPTTADLAGKWESEYGFFIIFDGEEGVFSGSNDEGAADDRLGILGTFALDGNELRLVENDDSESCPGTEGLFETAVTHDGKLRLTLVEDNCIYRVEGLFQGGQGGHRLLEFKRIKE